MAVDAFDCIVGYFSVKKVNFCRINIVSRF